MTIQQLVDRYHYKPLPKELSVKQRKQYEKELPSCFSLNGTIELRLEFKNFPEYL